MPALPLDEAGKYVAAAYLVFLALLIIYVAIMGMKIARIEREIGELLEAGAGGLPGRWIAVLALYDLVFGLVALAIFDFLLEE